MVQVGNYPVNEGGPCWLNNSFFKLMNPAFWQNVDQRVMYTVNKGFIYSIAQGIGRSMSSDMQFSDHARLARYILARYGAFPTVWITCQEFNCPNSCADCWARVAAQIYDLDPYKRPNTLHQCTDVDPDYMRAELWHTFVALQQGHSRTQSVDHWLAVYNAQPAKPVIEDEANYENIIPAYGKVLPWMSRQSGFHL